MQFGAENTASWERGGESDAGPTVFSFLALLMIPARIRSLLLRMGAGLFSVWIYTY